MSADSFFLSQNSISDEKKQSLCLDETEALSGETEAPFRLRKKGFRANTKWNTF
ncbi:hypothetical protein JCM6292_1560 [Bacteroides pyogenes JCM 6292]|uniref:Uncharacterized protein n=2 Tax=Bacteroides pyogenes TaxID=310300 RepID=W4PM26_9BACE|nr:hypothetical protein JCM6292_1560 [Bacteroides pyogenes JCM 6292]GAE20179.1 hypothetical protein JCM6294_3338 [Bacteroides pyogenes DSM 20611 = JCM 6294]